MPYEVRQQYGDFTQIPADTYAVPIGPIAYTANRRVDAEASGSATYTVWNGPWFRLTISNPSRVTVTLSWTFSGTGGYTATATLPANGSSVEFYLPVPVPFDEIRTLTATWTGGTTVIARQIGQWSFVMLCPGTLPSGFDAVDMAPLFGRHALLRQHTALSDWVGGLDPFSPGSVSFYGTEFAETATHTVNCLPVGPLACDDLARVANFGACSARSVLSNLKPLLTTSVLANYVGLPTLRGGTWERSFHTPPTLHGVSTTSTQAMVRRSRVYILTVGNQASAYTINYDITRDTDWGPNSTGVTIATGSLSIPAMEPPKLYEVGGGVIGPSASGLRVGTILMASSNTVTFLVVDEPCPLPIHIPATDNRIVPGGTTSEARATAKGADIITVAGTDFLYDDAAARGAWIVRFTGLTTGLYRVDRFNATPTLNQRMATSPDSISQDIVGNSVVSLVTRGELYVRPEGIIGTPPAYAGWKIVRASVPMTPYVLTVGANVIGSDLTKLGYPSGLGATIPWAFAFHAFTAPATGRYQFKYADTMPVFARAAAWYSTSDPYAPHDRPDAVDVSIAEPLRGVTITTLNTPPTSNAGGAFIRHIIGASPTGVWVGHAGKLAEGYHAGASGGQIDWRLYEPENGRIVFLDGQYRIYRDGAWLIYTDNRLVFEVDMTGGQTLYVRYGQCDGYVTNPGGMSGRQRSIVASLTVTVTAV